MSLYESMFGTPTIPLQPIYLEKGKEQQLKDESNTRKPLRNALKSIRAHVSDSIVIANTLNLKASVDQQLTPLYNHVENAMKAACPKPKRAALKGAEEIAKHEEILNKSSIDLFSLREILVELLSKTSTDSIADKSKNINDQLNETKGELKEAKQNADLIREDVEKKLSKLRYKIDLANAHPIPDKAAIQGFIIHTGLATETAINAALKNMKDKNVKHQNAYEELNNKWNALAVLETKVANSEKVVELLKDVVPKLASLHQKLNELTPVINDLEEKRKWIKDLSKRSYDQNSFIPIGKDIEVNDPFKKLTEDIDNTKKFISSKIAEINPSKVIQDITAEYQKFSKDLAGVFNELNKDKWVKISPNEKDSYVDSKMKELYYDASQTHQAELDFFKEKLAQSVSEFFVKLDKLYGQNEIIQSQWKVLGAIEELIINMKENSYTCRQKRISQKNFVITEELNKSNRDSYNKIRKDIFIDPDKVGQESTPELQAKSVYKLLSDYVTNYKKLQKSNNSPLHKLEKEIRTVINFPMQLESDLAKNRQDERTTIADGFAHIKARWDSCTGIGLSYITELQVVEKTVGNGPQTDGNVQASAPLKSLVSLRNSFSIMAPTTGFPSLFDHLPKIEF